MDEHPLLTARQVQAQLAEHGVSVQLDHVRKLHQQGKLVGRYLHPRLLLFPPSEVERFLRERRPRGRPRKEDSNEDAGATARPSIDRPEATEGL